ncbi:ankyrin repeat domain-containing protein 35 [Anas acuta]|uniref:ankyrin repeat domain-containing protein 35 n=1 Tax=Anas acuta TaxID=28680 RepID=UPI0035C935E9
MLAARGNHAAVCAQLLQSGADPKLTDGDKKTALDLAHEHGATEAAAQLLHHGGHGRTHRENGSGGAGDPELQGCSNEDEEEEEEEDKKEEEEEEEQRGERGTQHPTDLLQQAQDSARPPPSTGSEDEDDDDEGSCLAPPAEHELARRRRRRKAEEEPTEPGGTRAPQEGAGRGAEVQELQERNGRLAAELARLRLERGRLRDELRGLRGLRERDPPLGAAEEGGNQVGALCRALEAKREEAARLRGRLAAQRRELEELRERLGRGLRGGQDEAGGPLPDSCVLQELQRRLEALARSQHEALQLVAEMEAEEAAGRGGDGDSGEGTGGEGTGGSQPGELGEPGGAPGGLRELQERLEEARAEAGRWEAAAAAERRAKEEAEARGAQRELEAAELREKLQGLQRTLGGLRNALRDREAKTKQLLAEAEALAAAVLAARSEGARLRLQLQVQQKAHRDVVAVYRSHLLNAAQGFMDEAVHGRLLRILRAEEWGQDAARH